MGVYEETCDTKLALGIGLGNPLPKSRGDHQEELNDPLSLNLSFGFRASSCGTIAESSKNSSSNEEEEGNNDRNNGSRKKLRLTKEQSSVLEDSFKEHTTLNTAQKNNLAKMLNLKPRQVEVWFQNRRARTKLKQMETDCERWKRSCEELTDENKRLKKEVSDLHQALKIKERTTLFNPTNNGTADSVCPTSGCWRSSGK